MKKVLIGIISITCFTIACKENPKPTSNATAEKVKTKEDTLYQAVMDLHNETMAKYGKLLGYQKKAQQNIDSAKIMMKDKSIGREKPLHIIIVNTTLIDTLKAAENSMNNWMSQFNPDPKMKTTEDRADYFLDQKEKATIMKDGFFNALAKADSLLKTQ